MKKILFAGLIYGLLSTTGCAQTPVPFSQGAAQAKVLTAETYYEGVLTLAVAYNSLPRCTSPVTVVVCSDPAIVGKIRTYNNAALAAFGAAANTVNTPGITDSVANAAIVAATNAANALKSVIPSK